MNILAFSFKLVILCVIVVHGAKILAVLPLPAMSHHIVYQPILKELALRGHELTVITPYPLRDPTLGNLTEIDVGFAREIFNFLCRGHWENAKVSPWWLATFHYPTISQIVQAELSHPQVEDLISDKTKNFDVVLIEAHQPLLYAFGARFNCPMVVLTFHYANINTHFALGNPSHPITTPEIKLRFTENLEFFQRVESVLFSLYLRMVYSLLVLPLEDMVARKHFGKHIPYLGDLEKNISLLLTNTHLLINGVRPNVPTVVELGKIPRVSYNQSLPYELQSVLDSATEGVIYFSLGSSMKPSVVLKDKLKFITDTFSKLPQKVLWKWDKDVLPAQPKNVMISKWVSQEKVLRHPNVRLFVTQGGPQSLEEALAALVPVLVIPLQFDQFALAKRAVFFGIGQMLDVESFDRKTFEEVVVDIMNNPRYKGKVEELAVFVEDQPINGLNKAVWWIEYVIRHKGTRHLQSPGVDMPLYQYYLLDVLAAVVVIILLLSYAVFSGIFKVVTYVRKRLQKKSKIK